MSILIKQATILTQNKKRQQLFGDLYIDEQEIVEISTKPLTIEADYKLEGKHKLVLPGLINAHTHIPMTLLRGYGDDMLLQDWLEQRIWPVEAKLTKKTVEVGTKLGLLEMIASGTTSYVDMYFFENDIAKVTEKAGIRGFLGFALIDGGTPEYTAQELFSHCEHFVKHWKDNPLIKPVVAPHGAYTCGPETLRKAFDLSMTNNIPLHLHCSETRDEVYDVQQRYGERPIGHLKKYGILDKHTLLAHCGWVTKNEIVDIKEKEATVVHCPVSNMKIGTGGYAPIPEFHESAIPISLGTDGAASNNSLDMFDTMKFCALLHKQHRWDPSILNAQTVFDFATRGGAACLHMDDKIGSIEEGKKADIVLLDLHKPHLTPQHDPISHLVYAARGSDVCTTIINGQPLMLDREFFTLDQETILTEAEHCAKELTN
jgi:5-methylthioadenosine/S-adenosylhomocysteine deaminase